jgi:hypothetical protein
MTNGACGQWFSADVSASVQTKDKRFKGKSVGLTVLLCAFEGNIELKKLG